MPTFERAAVLVSGSRFTEAILNFAGILLFTRLLGPGGIGEFFLFQAVMTFLVFLSNLSIRNAVEKRISQGGPRPDIISTALAIMAVVLPIVCLVLFAAGEWIENYVGLPVTGPLVVGVVLSQAGGLFVKIIAGDLRIDRTAAIRLSRTAVWLVGGLALVHNGMGPMALVYSFVGGRLVYALWALYRCDLAFGTPRLDVAKSLATYAKYDLVSASSHRIHNWADVLVLGFFASSAAVGLYEVAWRVTQLAGLLSKSVSKVLFPEVSDAYAEGDMARVRESIQSALVWSIAFVLPALVGGILVGDAVLEVFFEITATEGHSVLSILFLGQIVFVHFTIVKRVLDGIDEVRLSARATGFMALFNVFANVVLVSFFGVTGAAVATSLSMVLGLAIVVAYLRRFLKLSYPVREGATFTVASVVMGGVVATTALFVDLSTYLGLLSIVMLGVIVYLGVVSLESSTRQFIREQFEGTVSPT